MPKRLAVQQIRRKAYADKHMIKSIASAAGRDTMTVKTIVTLTATTASVTQCAVAESTTTRSSNRVDRTFDATSGRFLTRPRPTLDRVMAAAPDSHSQAVSTPFEAASSTFAALSVERPDATPHDGMTHLCRAIKACLPATTFSLCQSIHRCSRARKANPNAHLL